MSQDNLPQNSHGPSREWVSAVRFQRGQFENSNDGVEYRDIFDRRYKEDLREMTMREIELAKCKGELQPDSKVEDFQRLAERRLERAKAVGDKEAAVKASDESERLFPEAGHENPGVLERPIKGKDDARFDTAQWKKICHSRLGGYRYGVGIDRGKLDNEIIEARNDYTADDRQETIAGRLVHELGPPPRERQPMWAVQEQREFAVAPDLDRGPVR